MHATTVCVYCVSRARIRSRLASESRLRQPRVSCVRVAAVLISANERPFADEIVASADIAGDGPRIDEDCSLSQMQISQIRSPPQSAPRPQRISRGGYRGGERNVAIERGINI